MSWCACRVASAGPLIVTIQLPVVFCRLVSISMWAPVVSRIALILHPPRPITRLMTEDETDIFLDLLTTSFQPSSCFLPFLGLGKVDILVVAVVVVRVTARHWAAAVATVMGDRALWGVVRVMMVLATTLVISAVFITLITSVDFPVDVGVTAAVIAILVSVSREPVDDFLVLTPLTVLLSITADVLSGGGKTLVFTLFTAEIFLSGSLLSSLFSFSAMFLTFVSASFSVWSFFFFFCFFLSLFRAAAAFFSSSRSFSKSICSRRIDAFLLASAAWRSLAVIIISIFL